MNVNNLIGTNVVIIGPVTGVFPLGTTEAQLPLGDYDLWVAPNFSLTISYSTNSGSYTNTFSTFRFVDDGNYGGFRVNRPDGSYVDVTPGNDYVAQIAFDSYWTFSAWGIGFNETQVVFPTNQDGVCRMFYGPAYTLQNLTNHAPSGGTVTTNYTTNGTLGEFLYTFGLESEYDAIDLRHDSANAYRTGQVTASDLEAWTLGFEFGVLLIGGFYIYRMVLGIFREKTIGTAD